MAPSGAIFALARSIYPGGRPPGPPGPPGSPGWPGWPAVLLWLLAVGLVPGGSVRPSLSKVCGWGVRLSPGLADSVRCAPGFGSGARSRVGGAPHRGWVKVPLPSPPIQPGPRRPPGLASRPASQPHTARAALPGYGGTCAFTPTRIWANAHVP